MDAGAVVLELLETNFGGQPTRSDLDAWITKNKLPVTSVIDGAGHEGESFTALGRRENTFIVELPSMKIVKKYTGSIDGTPPSSVSTAIPDLLALLGK